MSDELATDTPETLKATALAIYGRDEAGKAHASRFAADEALLAEKAADLMGMKILRLETVEHQELAAKLPAGRLFESGRAFVPFVKSGLYEQLAGFGEGSPARHPQQQSSVTGQAATPTDATDGAPFHDRTDAAVPASLARVPAVAGLKGEDPLMVGEVVLAPELEASWWEAVIVAVDDDLVTLQWRDFPGEPSFYRERHQIAFLPAGYVLPV